MNYEDRDSDNSNSESDRESGSSSDDDPGTNNDAEITEAEDEEQAAANPADNQLLFFWHEYSGNHKTFPFIGNEGIQINLPANCTPLDVFKLFFSPDLIAIIVEETNRYAA
ncbi:hypothetical protein NQ314_016576 [Rhamnusium bicolor]|uniref:PiggyBac transposable element-derived protein domain-containing protein n=1 Tax=Rhamnusium bicolor TaxID=1586634 RepID=A0AAV8WWN3_9CUCU|nr:hypothetical protein NQ314_016576 [Rhamnusium bicolor]